MKEPLILPEFINTYLNSLLSYHSYLINQLIHSGAVMNSMNFFGQWDETQSGTLWDPDLPWIFWRKMEVSLVGHGGSYSYHLSIFGWGFSMK